MVLTRRRRGIALLFCLALLLPGGCAWVDSEAPGPEIVEPVPYAREPVTPDEQELLRGFRLSASTSEIQAFLGKRNFRIAVSLHDGSAGIFVLEPGMPEGLPRIRRYSYGRETFSGRGIGHFARCALSPDGNTLVYSLEENIYGPQTILWLLNLTPGRSERFPLLSRANGGYGLRGRLPFWRVSGGRSFIGFHGTALEGGIFKGESGPWYADEAQMVEVLSDSMVSPAFPLEVGGSRIAAEVGGVSRDARWVLNRGHSGFSYLVPATRLPDIRSLPESGLLPEFFVGRNAALNPFDPAATGRTDYHATFPYSIHKLTGDKGDTILDPRALDGRRITETHPLAGDDVWICDGGRRIIFSLKLGAPVLGKRAVSPVDVARSELRAIWTTHPNFVLIHSSRAGAWIVKLAPSEEALFDDPGTQTLPAAGALRLLQADPDQDIDFAYAFEDISMWIGEDR